MATDYVKQLKSLLTYQAGNINVYDQELFQYCKRVGFDLGDILANYFAHNRDDIVGILETENAKNYDNTVLTKILILKKMSAEQKFRDAYEMNSDRDISILKESESLWT
jgi:hypothetical protein